MKTTREIITDWLTDDKKTLSKKWYSEEELENAKKRAYDEGHRDGGRS